MYTNLSMSLHKYLYIHICVYEYECTCSDYTCIYSTYTCIYIHSCMVDARWFLVFLGCFRLFLFLTKPHLHLFSASECFSRSGRVFARTHILSCTQTHMHTLSRSLPRTHLAEGYVRVDRDGQLKLFNCNIAQVCWHFTKQKIRTFMKSDRRVCWLWQASWFFQNTMYTYEKRRAFMNRVLRLRKRPIFM